MVPSTFSILGGQREEGHAVVHHVQAYLLQHNQNASIQDRQIQ